MHRGFGENRLEVVLDSVLGQEHQSSKLVGVDPADQMTQKFALAAVRAWAAANSPARSAGELSSKVTAMSRASADRESYIRAARRVSQRPPARCTRAIGAWESMPASVASNCSATL